MRRSLHLALVVVLATAGLVLMAVPVVDLVRGGREAASAQADLRAELESRSYDTAAAQPVVAGSREHPVVPPAGVGEPLATLRVPRFGADWSWVIVEGTEEEQLARGPGHYAGTPLPGARGNVGIAGHRAGHGDPFLDFDRLRVGDTVEVERDGTTWTYTLTSAPEIIEATDTWVLDRTPGRQLTLTTCWPKWGSSKRMFVRAELTDVRG